MCLQRRLHWCLQRTEVNTQHRFCLDGHQQVDLGGCQRHPGLIHCKDTPAKPHTDTHSQHNARQHIPLRNTTAERLCYDISNQKRRQASGFGRLKGTVEENGEKGMWGSGRRTQLTQGYPRTEPCTSHF